MLVIGAVAYVLALGWSWATLAVLAGMALVALAIYLLRPRLAWQAALSLVLLAAPTVLLAWRERDWASIVFLGGMLVPLVVVLVTVSIVLHVGSQPRPVERTNPSPPGHHGGSMR